MTKPRREMFLAVGQIAEGDITSEVSYAGRSEIGMLDQVLNKMATNPCGILLGLADDATALQSTSDNLSTLSAPYPRR